MHHRISLCVSHDMAMVHAKAEGDLARLEGPVRLVVPYSGRDVAPGVATRGGVYDAWFRAGGTRALLYAAARQAGFLGNVGRVEKGRDPLVRVKFLIGLDWTG